MGLGGPYDYQSRLSPQRRNHTISTARPPVLQDCGNHRSKRRPPDVLYASSIFADGLKVLHELRWLKSWLYSSTTTKQPESSGAITVTQYPCLSIERTTKTPLSQGSTLKGRNCWQKAHGLNTGTGADWCNPAKPIKSNNQFAPQRAGDNNPHRCTGSTSNSGGPQSDPVDELATSRPQTPYYLLGRSYSIEVRLSTQSSGRQSKCSLLNIYLIEYSRCGLSDPSLPQPSSSRPFHYKPIDFVFYDIDAPKRQGLNTVEELVQYLMADDYEEEKEDEDMEEEPWKAASENASSAKPAGALKTSSYAAPPVKDDEYASAAQPSSGPEQNITGESCLLTAFVDPVIVGLHPTQVLMERAKLIVTIGCKVGSEFDV